MNDNDHRSYAVTYAVCAAICIGAMWLALLIVAGAR